jgi:cytochrome c-type biogenesis protein CcmH/NrfG
VIPLVAEHISEEGLNDPAPHPGEYALAVERARAQLQDRVQSNPEDVEGWFNLGILSRDAGQVAEAEEYFHRVVILAPMRSDACVELGLLRRNAADLHGAVAWYRRALDLDPQCVSARFNLANCARDEEAFDAAAADYSLILRMEPDHHGAWVNLGFVYQQQLRYAEAMQCYQQAMALRPDIAGTYVNIGNLLKAQNENEGAIAAYRAALQLEPGSAEAHHSLGLAYLTLGDFTRGWEQYEWRLRCRDTGGRIGARTFARPLWRGEDPSGKTILVYAEQGYGDNIQFARFLPLLQERGAKVIFACYPHLVKLFSRFTGVDQLVALEAQDELPQFDAYAALLSLPALLRIDPWQVSPVIPYLWGDEKRVRQWAGLKTRGRIAAGLVWASNTRNLHARLRSLALSDLAPLLSRPDIDFYSLQIESPGQSKAFPELRRNICFLGSAIETFEETAAIVENLDLVLSVDTAVAHLAGAMGKAVWVLLPYDADWRWLRERDDTPWYPGMRLFRQESLGRWDEAVAKVCRALAALSVGK